MNSMALNGKHCLLYKGKSNGVIRIRVTRMGSIKGESLFCALEWVLFIYFRPHFCIWFHLHAIFLSQSLINSVTWNTLTVFVWTLKYLFQPYIIFHISYLLVRDLRDPSNFFLFSILSNRYYLHLSTGFINRATWISSFIFGFKMFRRADGSALWHTHTKWNTF